MLRQVGVRLHRAACEGLIRWGANPRVDALLLRRALEGSNDDDALTVPASTTYQMEYLIYLALLDDRDTVARRMRHDLRYWREGPLCNDRMSPEHKVTSFSPCRSGGAEWARRVSTEVGWYSAQEPERSRRVLRILVANCLAHADDPPDHLAAIAVRNPLLYATTPADPTPARALAPDELAGWYAASELAKIDPDAFNGTLEESLAGERAAQRKLREVLAAELAKRADQRPSGGH